MNRRLFGLMLIIVLIPAFGIAYLLSTPRLEQFSPEDNAAEVSAGEALRLTFSHNMLHASVLERLTISPPAAGRYTWEGNTLVFQPDAPWPNGENVRVQLQAGARAQNWPRFSIREETSWSFQIGYPRLAFLYPADAAAQIYILDPQTGESLAITDTAAGVLEYDVDPGGERIIYSANNGLGGSDLYRLDGIRLTYQDQGTIEDEQEQGLPEGEQQQQAPVRILACSQDECRAPVISPEGNYLAFERTGEPAGDGPAYPQVWLLPMQPDGSIGDPVLAGPEGRQTLMPSWSADGMLAYYDSREAAFIFQDPSSGQQVQVPNETGQPGAWSPSGEAFVAPEVATVIPKDLELGQSGQDPLLNSHLVRFQLSDETTEDLTQTEDTEDGSPSYAPDGSLIAFSRRYLDINRWTPGRQLWLMRSDGSDAQPLTNDPYFTHYDFAWDPQGSLIAFVRFNQSVLSNPPEVWVVDPQTTEAHQYVSGGYAPEWIP